MLKTFQGHQFIESNSENQMNFSFVGEMLAENIQNEWLLSSICYTDEPSFKFRCLTDPHHFQKAYLATKSIVNKLPLGFVEVFSQPSRGEEKENLKESIMQKYFAFPNKTVLRKLILCLPEDGTSTFHQQQRKRHIWWRKFSSVPSRFNVTPVLKGDKDSSSTEIAAEFPWGTEKVEVIKHMPNLLIDDPTFHEVTVGRKIIVPHVITSETHLETISILYLCDAYDPLNEDTEKEVMSFHRKIAPYKFAFAAYGSTAEISSNLQQLALVLARDIRKRRVSTLLLPDMCKTSFESQFSRNDTLGIPYTIVLKDKTLKDGILTLRSRETTLMEQSHVSKLVDYAELLVKNY